MFVDSTFYLIILCVYIGYEKTGFSFTVFIWVEAMENWDFQMPAKFCFYQILHFWHTKSMDFLISKHPYPCLNNNRSNKNNNNNNSNKHKNHRHLCSLNSEF